MTKQATRLAYAQVRTHTLTVENDIAWVKFVEPVRTLQGSPAEDWEFLKVTLDYFRDVIARVEFFHWTTADEREYRGAIIFDNHGDALVHTINALLGYEGRGAILAKDIMTSLGVPEALFDKVNATITKYEYHPVVFTRERKDKQTGGIITGGPLEENWNWWLSY